MKDNLTPDEAQILRTLMADNGTDCYLCLRKDHGRYCFFDLEEDRPLTYREAIKMIMLGSAETELTGADLIIFNDLLEECKIK